MAKPIPAELLQPGTRLAGSVHDESGTCLIEAGTLLAPDILERLSRDGHDRLYAGDDWPDYLIPGGTGDNEPADGTEQDVPAVHPKRPAGASWHDLGEKTLSIDRFREELYASILGGLSLPHDIYDEHGVLLLAAGIRISPRFLQLLKDRGVQSVSLRPPAPSGTTPGPSPDPPTGPAPLVVEKRPQGKEKATGVLARLDAQLAGELGRQPPFRPVKAWRRPRLSIDSFKSEAVAGLERHVATSMAVAGFCEQLDGCMRRGARVSDAEIRQPVAKLADMAAQDFDLLPYILSMQDAQDDYLFDHCVNVALLSVALASQLGLPHDNIVEIGLGALLQDIGMLRVPAPIRTATRPLSPEERKEIERHPLHTLDLLEGIRGLPQAVKLIAYQSHERMDGSGYPRHRCGAQIHHFARIVAAADAYAARTHPRPHRPAMPPYEALKAILVEASQDRFDSTIVRAFLDTISLFPIGSLVQLNTGVHAQVLRSNPSLHTRPVLEALDHDGSPTGQIIDLSQIPDLSVVRAIGAYPPVPAV